MYDFTQLPVHWVDLRRLTWPDHDISPAHLANPEQRREIDSIPICVELLVTGDLYVHDGRHRSIRAISRGEHQIKAYVYTKSRS